MARPKGDLGGLAMPKDAGASSGEATAPAAGGKAYAHTLSLRLTAEGYRRLRRHVVAIEEQTGQRVTHQAVIETALAEYLDRQGG